MSVYIKGMEIPTGTPVLFCVHPDGKVFADEEGAWHEYKAFPVPDHGRLIDADALRIGNAEKEAYEAYVREKKEFFIEEPVIEYLRGKSEGLIRAANKKNEPPETLIYQGLSGVLGGEVGI